MNSTFTRERPIYWHMEPINVHFARCRLRDLCIYPRDDASSESPLNTRSSFEVSCSPTFASHFGPPQSRSTAWAPPTEHDGLTPQIQQTRKPPSSPRRSIF